jgi:sugar phosphate permease
MFMLSYANYAVLHATRSAWSLASKDLISEYGFKEGTVSDMNATFLGFYAAGGFFLSTLGDRYDKRKLIVVMYSLIALVEVALGLIGFIPAEQQKAWPYFIIKILNGTL